MREARKFICQLGLFAVFQMAWSFLFYKFDGFASDLIEYWDHKAEHQGEFYPLLCKQLDWELGWILIYGAPILSLICFCYFLRKSKPEWSWISLLSIQLPAALLAIVLIIAAIFSVSCGLW